MQSEREEQPYNEKEPEKAAVRERSITDTCSQAHNPAPMHGELNREDPQHTPFTRKQEKPENLMTSSRREKQT